MTRPVRIVFVEDNDVFREALELLFSLRDDVEVVASVGDGAQAVEAVQRTDAHVVLMDYRLPGLDGVQATKAVRAACPNSAVVCLTASAGGSEIEALLTAGATACLTKDQELEEIVATIKQAAESRAWT